MASECDLQNPGEMLLGLEDFNEHANSGNGIGKKNAEKEDCSSFAMKKDFAWQTHGLKRNRKNNRKYFKDAKAIPWELQHRLVATDINKRKLKENNMKTRFHERIKELVDADTQE